MRVREVMSQGVQCIAPESTLQEAACKMKEYNFGSLPVCDGDRLIGMITDRDIAIRSVSAGDDPTKCPVREIMTPSLVYSFDDAEVEDAATLMQQKQIRRLPILNRDKRLVGIVSLGDLAVQTHDEVLAGHTLEAVSEPEPAKCGR